MTQRHPFGGRVGAYLVAVIVVAIAVGLRLSLDPWLGNRLPFVTLFGAVAVAVWVGGVGAAILAATLGYLACSYLYLGLGTTTGFPDPSHTVGIAVYFLTCTIIVISGAAMRRTRRREWESAELLRVTFASIGDGVLSTDALGNIVQLNPVAEHLTGWAQAEAKGKPLEVVYDAIDEATRQPIRVPLDCGTGSTPFERPRSLILRSRRGMETPIDDNVSPIRDGDGKVIGCVLTFRDVVARRQEDRRFREMADAAPVLIWISDAQGQRIWFNTRWLEFVGGAAQGEDAGGWTDNVHPEDLDRCVSTHAHAFDRRESFALEYRLRRFDGEYRWVLDNGIPRFGDGGEFLGYLGSCVDISSSRDASERLRSLVETVLDGIVTMDSDGRIETINPAGEVLFGYTAAEIVGQNVGMLMPEPFQAEHNTYISRYLETGEAKVIGIGREVEGRRKDGSTFPMDLSVSEFVLGERRYFTGVVRDITEQQLTLTKLQEADRRKDEFLATLAHELRNPLAPLVSGLELLKLVQTKDPSMVQIRGLLERQVALLVRLVDDLLDVSRVSSGKLRLDMETVDLAQVLEIAIETAWPLIEAGGHELTVAITPEPVPVRGDSTRLAQLFVNLLNNAAKYTTEAGHIQLALERHGTEAVVRVRDNGIGIPAHQLPDIFEMFSQTDHALGRAQGGLGIGLSLVKGLVGLHGGTIEASSEGINLGSEFVVRLPLEA